MKEQEQSWMASEKENNNLDMIIKRDSNGKNTTPLMFINGGHSSLQGFRSLVFLILLVNLVSLTNAQFGSLSASRSYLAAAAAGDKIVFAGGYNGSISLSTVDIYDVSTRTWNSTSTGAGQLSVARYRLAAGAAGNKIVFAGGFTPDTGYLSTVDIYDVTTGIWNSTSTGAGELGVARYRLAAAGIGNKIVFAGGYNAGDISTVDIYDVTTGTWNSTSTGAGQLSGARSDLAAAAAGNKIVFAGGHSSVTVDIYDVTTGTWNSTSTGAGQLGVARYDLVAAAAGDKIIFAGGVASSGLVSTVDIFDVITGTWNSTSTSAGQLNVARYRLAAAGIGYKIVFAGGQSASSSASVDIYDVITNAWTSTSTGVGQLSVARAALAAAAAGNLIVFAGGADDTEYLSTVDIYDSQYGMHLGSTTSTATTSTTLEATISTIIASAVSTASNSAVTTASVASATAATEATTTASAFATTLSATISSGGVALEMISIGSIAFAVVRTIRFLVFISLSQQVTIAVAI